MPFKTCGTTRGIWYAALTGTGPVTDSSEGDCAFLAELTARICCIKLQALALFKREIIG